MIRVLLIALALYFLYRFVFNFLVPLSKATREMKSKMNEFQTRMQQQQGFGAQTEPAKQNTPQPKGGDYIEFEEVK